MYDYTVIGGSGFIGSGFVDYLTKLGHSVDAPKKGDSSIFERELGTVIYCAGVGDCINQPFDVFDAHSKLLAELLKNANFKRFIYISSTRLYMGQESACENSDLSIVHSDKRKLFNLTKLVGEELCLLSGKNVIIVRPSNVYGLALNSPLFLPAITRNAINNGRVDMYVTPEYAKDYLALDDLLSAVYRLSQKESLSHIMYNIASGKNTTAGSIAKVLKAETGCEVNWVEGSVDEYFPVTDIQLILQEIDFHPADVLLDLELMVRNFKKVLVE